MGLLSNLSRKKGGASAAGAFQEPADAVQKARTRARQRLIGAVVLVVIGVIGFPLVFETQPRPIPVDIPIVIPRRDGAPPLVMPPARSPTTAAPAVAQNVPSAASAPAVASPPDEVITETRDQAGKEVVKDAAPSARPASAPVVAEKAASRPTPKPATAEPAPKVVAETKPAAKAADAVRAKALLEGTEPSAPAGARFVLQVGAFSDASAARETRLKVEKLGLKTYTQVADTPAGSRIRVRVGPFVSRDEADKALAKARGAGLSGVVLTL
ncbi:MAG: SPOR domain-containing protein [Burkholderiaceae bacterium]